MRRLISPTSSRNSVPLMRQLQFARLVAIGAGEAALDVAEQFGFEQSLGEAGAVDRNELPARARRARMDLAGNQILADAAFTSNEDFGIASGDASRKREDLAHLGTGVHQRTGLRRGRLRRLGRRHRITSHMGLRHSAPESPKGISGPTLLVERHRCLAVARRATADSRLPGGRRSEAQQGRCPVLDQGERAVPCLTVPHDCSPCPV